MVEVNAVVLIAGSESHTAAVNAIADAFALAASTEATSGAAAAAAEQPPVKISSSATFAVHPDQLPEGSQARTEFSMSFRTSMAGSFGGGNLIAPEKVVINAIGLSTRRQLQASAGTTTVDFHIETPLAVADHAASMMMTLASSNEKLSVSVGNETLGASSMASPVVTRAPDVNCTGTWSNCTGTCSNKMYLVSTTASGAGTACSAVHGATAACAFGDGNCQAPPTHPAPANAVKAKLTLNIDMSSITSTSLRAAFETNFKTDVAAHLEVTADRVVVNSVVSGSVIVDFHVLADASGIPIPTSVLNSKLISGASVAGSTLTVAVAGVERVAAAPTPAPVGNSVALPAEEDSNTAVIIVIIVASVVGLAIIVLLVFKVVLKKDTSVAGTKAAGKGAGKSAPQVVEGANVGTPLDTLPDDEFDDVEQREKQPLAAQSRSPEQKQSRSPEQNSWSPPANSSAANPKSPKLKKPIRADT